jgi:hypothetical protein
MEQVASTGPRDERKIAAVVDPEPCGYAVPAPPAVRAVVDPNLLIRGLLRCRPNSAAVGILDAAIDGAPELVLSRYFLSEVADTLPEPEVRALRGLTDQLQS